MAWMGGGARWRLLAAPPAAAWATPHRVLPRPAGVLVVRALASDVDRRDGPNAAAERAGASPAAAAGKKKRLPDRRELAAVFALARPEWKPLTASLGLLGINTTVNMALPYSMGRIIDYITTDTTSAEHVVTVIGALSAAFAVSAVAGGVRTYLMKMSGERIVTRLRQDVYSSLVHQEIAFFDTQRTGELINRLSTDTTIVGKTITNNIADGLRTISQVVVGASLMAYISPSLTLTILSIVPPLSLVGVFYGRYVRDLTRKTQDALAETTKVAEERLSGIRTVRANGQESAEVERYAARTLDVLGLARKEATASGGFYGLVNFMGNMSMLAVLWYGGSKVLAGAISVGDLATFLLYTVYVGGSIAGATTFYSELMKGVGAGSRVLELRDRAPRAHVGADKTLPQLRGRVEFRNVHFAYPSRADAPILAGLDLALEPGTVTAVVGQSGSGKSTLGALLLRLYDPQEGAVLVDGVDVRELSGGWYRSHVALVAQEPLLFAESIRDNIAYGAPGDVTDDDIREAAQRANAHAFIERFPEKYSTYVGERGVSLSGGQKQRVAIARALLKNPRILVLDEATSALDAESEFLVQEALERLMEGRTVVMIAHRLSTIKAADRIAVLRDGRVVELDTYDNLMASDTYFRRTIARTITAA